MKIIVHVLSCTCMQLEFYIVGSKRTVDFCSVHILCLVTSLPSRCMSPCCVRLLNFCPSVEYDMVCHIVSILCHWLFVWLCTFPHVLVTETSHSVNSLFSQFFSIALLVHYSLICRSSLYTLNIDPVRFYVLHRSSPSQ